MPSRTKNPPLKKRRVVDLPDILDELNQNNLAAVSLQDETGVQRGARINRSSGALEYYQDGKWHGIPTGASVVRTIERRGGTVSGDSGTSIHNLLGGIYGDADYYHLNASDYGALTDVNAQLSALQTDGSPTLAGLTLTGLTETRPVLTGSGGLLVTRRADESSQFVTLAAGESYPHGTCFAKGYVFACTYTNPAKVLRFDPEDLTSYDVVTLPNDTKHQGGSALIYVPAKDRLYMVGWATGRTVITEINPDTLTYSDVVDDSDQSGGGMPGLTSDGTSLYVITQASPALVLKYSLSDFSKTGSATLTGYSLGHAIGYDGEYLYVTGGTATGWVARVDPSNLAFTAESLPGAHIAPTDDLVMLGDYLYVGLEDGTGEVLRIAKATLTSVNHIYIGTAANIYGVFFDGRYIWVGLATAPGKLVRLDPWLLQTVTFQFPSGYNSPNELIIDGQRLFVTFWMSPAKLTRFSILGLEAGDIALADTVAGRKIVVGSDGAINIPGSLTVASLAGYIKGTAGLLSGQTGVPHTDLTYSGLTPGHVWRASGASAASFAAIQDADIPATIMRDSEHASDAHTMTLDGVDLSAFKALYDAHDHSAGDPTQVDHGANLGLADDDHTQYALAGASRAGTISVEAASAINQDLTTDAGPTFRTLNLLPTIYGTGLLAKSDTMLDAALETYSSAYDYYRPNFSLVRYRGTQAAPAAVASGDWLGNVRFRGYDGTAVGTGTEIRALASEAFTGSARGARLEFYTVAIGSTVLTLRMTIADSGNVTIAQNLRVDGSNVGTTADNDLLGLATNSLTVRGNLTLSAQNIITDTTTGMQVGTSALQKLGFFGATPVVRQAHIANPTDLTSCISTISAILVRLETFGFIATS